MKHLIRLFLPLMILGTVLLVSAQEETHPLLEMLALIPDSEIIRTGGSGSPVFYPFITYQDYDAIRQYAPTDITIETAEDLLTLGEDEQDNWYTAIALRSIFSRSLESPLRETGNELNPDTLERGGGPLVAEAVEIAFGFDYFDISRGLAFGKAPTQGTVYAIDYDINALSDALAERGYIDVSQMDVQVFCQEEDGCDGTDSNAADIEPENIFDSRLGRKPPIFASDGYLYSVFVEDLVTPLVETQIDEMPSLADADDYRVLAEAITQPDGDLLQALFLDAASLYSDVDLTEYETIDDISRIRQITQWADYQDMPLPTLVAFADRQTDAGQVIVFAAYYPTADDANVARDELARRMNRFSGEFQLGPPDMQPYIELTEADITPLDPTVYIDEDGGQGVVLVSYAVGQIKDSENFAEPYYGRELLALWVRAYDSNWFYPLWDITVPEWFVEDYATD